MINKIGKFAASPLFGLTVFLFAIAMEVTGLFVQYKMGYDPCDNCVIVRAYIALIGIMGLALMAASTITSCRTKLISISVMYLIGIYAAFQALLHSWDNHLIEAGLKISTCGFDSPFPSYLPLDTYLPSVFEKNGICGTKIYIYNEYTLTDLSIFAFAVMIATSVTLLIAFVFSVKKR